MGVVDRWMGCYYGEPQIPTFSALFMDDKAQMINKRRACQTSAYLILLMWCWLMEVGDDLCNLIYQLVWNDELENKLLFIQVQ